MFLFSAAARSVRAAYHLTSIKPLLRRDRTVQVDDADSIRVLPSGGRFLHWVPDRPDGCRLAGDFIPVELQPERHPVASRRPRRRR